MGALKVSVVVPVCAQTSSLRWVLKSLALQDERSFEVICVNDGGGQDVADLCASFRPHLNVRLYSAAPSGRPPRGAAAARNVGIRHAQAPRVLFVDSDCLCPSRLVGTHATLGANLISYVGFRRHVSREAQARLTEEDLKDIERLVPGKPEMRAEPGHLKNMTRYCQHNTWLIQSYLWTCHISYPTHILAAVGGFWEAMLGSGAEDCELGLRAWRAGVRYRILHAPSVYHLDHPQSPLQAQHLPNNRLLFFRTRDDRSAVVRNGGPLQRVPLA